MWGPLQLMRRYLWASFVTIYGIYTILPALKIGVFFNILCRFASASQPICQGPHMYPFIVPIRSSKSLLMHHASLLDRAPNSLPKHVYICRSYFLLVNLWCASICMPWTPVESHQMLCRLSVKLQIFVHGLTIIFPHSRAVFHMYTSPGAPALPTTTSLSS